MVTAVLPRMHKNAADLVMSLTTASFVFNNMEQAGRSLTTCSGCKKNCGELEQQLSCCAETYNCGWSILSTILVGKNHLAR